MISKVLLLCSVWAAGTIRAEINRKICASVADFSACEQIARTGEIACDNTFNHVDCLLDIQNNIAHLGRISGQDAMHAANLLSEDVVVLAEVRSGHPPSEIVVIIKNSIPNGIINLQNKKLCHPGYAQDLSFPHFMLQELENQVIEQIKPNCSVTNETLIERHVRTLSEFFGDSCRPGEWVQKQRYDNDFKTKYSSLCRLCDNQSCDEKYITPFNDTLNKCLLAKDGDVAITTLLEAKIFFNSTSNQQNYKYLCKDGSSKSSLSPCTWSSKLYDLIITGRKEGGNIETFLRNNMKTLINTTKTDVQDGKYKDALTVILKLDRNEKITFLEEYSSNYRSLKQYVTDRVSIPTPINSIQCNRTLRWCTYSDPEQAKCQWLSQAGAIWAIQPTVECTRSQGNDELSCLDDIRRNSTDIVVASSDYAYISFNKGLKSIAFPETDSRNLSVVLAVRRADNNGINNFNDMEHKKACIPRFGGKEHLVLVRTIRYLAITKNLCDYGKVLSDFVGDSCVPGVRNSIINEATENVDKDKLCSQCRASQLTPTADYCNDDYLNKYFDSKGAVDCLLDELGDFAIITNKTNIENSTDLKVICKNNTVASFNGLNVDLDCALAVLPNSEVVTSADNEKSHDIKLALFEFEKWFGQNLKKSFYLFDRFNGTKDLLFLDSTPGLNIDNDIQSIKDYKELLKEVKKCVREGSSSSRVLFSVFLLVVTSVMMIVRNL